LNNSYFQKKIFTSYFFSENKNNSFNVFLEDFDYRILNNSVKSNLYFTQINDQKKIDTILFLPDLTLKFNFLDLIFSNELNINHLNIESPIYFLNDNTINNKSFYEDILSFSNLITSDFLIKNIIIKDLNIKKNNNNFLNGVNISLSDITLKKNYIEIKKSNLLVDDLKGSFDFFLENNQSELNVSSLSLPLSSNLLKFSNNKYIIDSLELNVNSNIKFNKDSLITDTKLKFGKSQINLKLSKFNQISLFEFFNSSILSEDLTINTPYLNHIDTFKFDSHFSLLTNNEQNNFLDGVIITDFGKIVLSAVDSTNLNEIDLILENFEIGEMLNISSFGNVSCEANLSSPTYSLKEFDDFNLLISSIDYNKYSYRDIEIHSSSFSKKINFKINDKNLISNCSIQLGNKDSNSITNFSLSGAIKHGNLINLNLPLNKRLDYLSTDFKINNIGFLNSHSTQEKKISFLNSEINFSNIKYSNNKKVKKIDNINLLVNDFDKKIIFNSPIGSIYSESSNFIYSNFNFKNIFELLYTDCKNQLPFQINIDLNDASFFSDIFLNNVIFSDSLKFQLVLDEEKKIFLNGNIPYLEYDNYQFEKICFSNQNKTNNYFNSVISKIVLDDQHIFNNLSFSSDYIDKGIYKYQLNSSLSNSIFQSFVLDGNINFKPNGFFINFNEPSHLSLDNRLYQVDSSSKIIYHNESLFFDNLKFFKNNESISLIKSVTNPTIISFNCENIKLSNIQPFFNIQNLTFNGLLNGFFNYSIIQKSLLSSDAFIDNFSFNNVVLGKMKINQVANENISHSLGFINDGNNLLEFKTEYNLSTKNILGDFLFDQFPISVLDSLIKPVDSLVGLSSGQIKLFGPIDDYKLNGTLNLEKVNFNIPYLKTQYFLNNEFSLIKFNESQIILDNFLFYEKFHNTFADFNGTIKHKSLKEIAYNLDIKSDNLFVLNTNKYDNNSYYGNAFLRGTASVFGNSDKTTLNVDGKVLSKSRLMIPLSQSKEIKKNNLIFFQEKNSALSKAKTLNSNSKFNMNFNIDIDHESEIQLIFDEELGDIIEGSGQGDLLLKVNDAGNFEIFGDFTIDKGKYLFTLQDVISKSFNIDKGGVIKFNGDPYEAVIDLNLLYNVQASLNPLNPSYERTIKSPVICKMKMSEDLLSPNISFKIEIPNSDQIVETSLETMTNTEQKMLEQFLYLLVANSFLVENDSNIDYIGNTLATTGTELLSNQLSNWLSQTTDAFDLGFKWIPGTGDSLSFQQVELAVSKKFLDDRFIINGNVGTPQEQSQTNIVGDLDIEYSFFRDGRLKLRVFNRAKDYDPLSESLGYEQGIGLFYKKRFNNLTEIFQNKLKKD
tara:strand:- start:54341 stop:58366 length:4026 start_codon:yes stop_codon:yes gene_type:complete